MSRGHGNKSFREFLTDIKDTLRLEKFEVITDVVFDDDEEPYDRDWNSKYESLDGGLCQNVGLHRQMRSTVLGIPVQNPTPSQT
jgi:hypothetical protein